VDIRRLEQQAEDIVAGVRSTPRPPTRSDELGRLMAAVNDMAGQLDERERALELSKRNYAHQEKMAAVGSLAAGIAHEIGNPIAAIAGIAASICETSRARGCVAHGARCQPDLILEQTRRVALITREISDFASPRAGQAELIDLNQILRTTCSFIRFDTRFRHIDLTLALDKDLPAVVAVADKIVQVVMNLLINAADAIETGTDRQPSIVVATRAVGTAIEVHITDNGSGMSEEVARRAFEPFFTTKPSGKGTGLGLPLCKSLIEDQGGSIGFERATGGGTTFRVSLPTSRESAS
jgi:signal transduction histidine kinase